MGLEHPVEVAGLGQLASALGAFVALDMVCPETLAAFLAVYQRVHEGLLVAGVLPHQPVHDDGGVQPLHVLPAVDHALPPGLLDVVLQLHPQRAVIPGGAQAAVDLGGLEYEPPPLGQGYYFFKGVFRSGHVNSSQ